LIATNTGVDLILTIQEDLLKSAELTGLWEKKLRQVEKGEYDAKDFLEELKEMVRQIVFNVKSDNRQIQHASQNIEGTKCPICGKGLILKGNKAYGCSEWKSGCAFRKAFD